MLVLNKKILKKKDKDFLIDFLSIKISNIKNLCHRMLAMETMIHICFMARLHQILFVSMWNKPSLNMADKVKK